jgi:hypothetical protein
MKKSGDVSSMSNYDGRISYNDTFEAIENLQNLKNSAPGATYKSICSDLIKSGAIQSAKVGKATLQFKIQQNTLP